MAATSEARPAKSCRKDERGKMAESQYIPFDHVQDIIKQRHARSFDGYFYLVAAVSYPLDCLPLLEKDDEAFGYLLYRPGWIFG